MKQTKTSCGTDLASLPDRELFDLYDTLQSDVAYFVLARNFEKRDQAEEKLEEVANEISRRDEALFRQDCESGEAWGKV